MKAGRRSWIRAGFKSLLVVGAVVVGLLLLVSLAERRLRWRIQTSSSGHVDQGQLMALPDCGPTGPPALADLVRRFSQDCGAQPAESLRAILAVECPPPPIPAEVQRFLTSHGGALTAAACQRSFPEGARRHPAVAEQGAPLLLVAAWAAWSAGDQETADLLAAGSWNLNQFVATDRDPDTVLFAMMHVLAHLRSARVMGPRPGPDPGRTARTALARMHASLLRAEAEALLDNRMPMRLGGRLEQWIIGRYSPDRLDGAWRHLRRVEVAEGLLDCHDAMLADTAPQGVPPECLAVLDDPRLQLLSEAGADVATIATYEEQLLRCLWDGDGARCAWRREPGDGECWTVAIRLRDRLRILRAPPLSVTCCLDEQGGAPRPGWVRGTTEPADGRPP